MALAILAMLQEPPQWLAQYFHRAIRSQATHSRATQSRTMGPVSSVNRMQATPTAISEVPISSLFMLLLYPLQNTGRSVDSGKILLSSFVHSMENIIVIPRLLPNRASLTLADVHSVLLPQPLHPSTPVCTPTAAISAPVRTISNAT